VRREKILKFARVEKIVVVAVLQVWTRINRADGFARNDEKIAQVASLKVGINARVGVFEDEVRVIHASDVRVEKATGTNRTDRVAIVPVENRDEAGKPRFDVILENIMGF